LTVSWGMRKIQNHNHKGHRSTRKTRSGQVAEHRGNPAGFFLRAPLHCVPASQKNRHAGSSCARISTPPSQKRARRGPRGLRRKELFWRQPVRHDFAALESLRSSRAKRSSRALTLVSWAEAREGMVNRIPPYRRRGRNLFSDFDGTVNSCPDTCIVNRSA